MPLYSVTIETKDVYQYLVRADTKDQAILRAEHSGLGVMVKELLTTKDEVTEVSEISGWKESK